MYTGFRKCAFVILLSVITTMSLSPEGFTALEANEMSTVMIPEELLSKAHLELERFKNISITSLVQPGESFYEKFPVFESTEIPTEVYVPPEIMVMDPFSGQETGENSVPDSGNSRIEDLIADSLNRNSETVGVQYPADPDQALRGRVIALNELLHLPVIDTLYPNGWYVEVFCYFDNIAREIDCMKDLTTTHPVQIYLPKDGKSYRYLVGPLEYYETGAVYLEVDRVGLPAEIVQE